MTKKSTLFISYRREGSADLARYLHDELERRGGDLFFDVESLNSGDHFEARIRQEVVNREYFLVILTPTTLESEWVRKEVGLALECQKKIIPVYTKGFDFYRSIPTELKKLAEYNAVEYDFRTPQTAIQNIADTLFGDAKRKPFSPHRRMSAYLILGLIALIAAVISLRLLSQNSGATFTITGDNPIVLNESTVAELTINQGDSPEEIARKASLRAKALASELSTYITNLDQRLYQINTVITRLEEDAFGEALSDKRGTIVPAMADAANAGYSELILDTEITGLRQIISTLPLPTVQNSAFVSLSRDSELAQNNVQALYTQMSDVQQKTENLLAAIEDLKEGENISEWDVSQVELNFSILHNRSQLAYLTILSLVGELQEQQPETFVALNALQMLEPNTIPSFDENYRLQQVLAEEAESFNDTKASLIATGEAQGVAQISSYDIVLQESRINPQDSWEVVIAKAVSLRQFGLIEEAAASFAQYGDMFRASDSTAEQYAAVAQAFTRQMESLSIVNGAVYIFAVQPESAAMKAGLQEGDIVIAFGGSTIPDAIVMSEALEKIVVGGRLDITILRLEDNGTFERLEITLIGEKPLGIGVMPI